METERLGPEPGRYGMVTSVLSLAEPYADKPLPCEHVVTDQPYVVVSWRRAGATRKLGLQYGCQSAEAMPVVERVAAAQAMVGGLVNGPGPILAPPPPR